MFSISILLIFAHILGLVLGVGSATVKLLLLFKSKSDYSFIPVFLKVVKPITQLIVLGLLILTLSGIGLLIIGYSFTPLLIVKVIIVGVVWVLGPVIDNVVEPKFVKLASLPEEYGSQQFVRIHKQYFVLELTATLLFYVCIIMGVLL